MLGNRQDSKLGNPSSQSVSPVIIGLDLQDHQQREARPRLLSEDSVRTVEIEVRRQLLRHRALQHGGSGEEESSESSQVSQREKEREIES